MRSLVVVAILASLLSACGGDAQEEYCDRVESGRDELARTLDANGGLTGLLDAQEQFAELADRAPADIAGEWRTFTAAIRDLADALDDAGLDSSEVKGTLPSSLTKAERTAIEQASIRLAGGEVKEAAAAMEQHARDVCHVPLF